MNVKIYLSSKLVEQCTFCQLFGLIEVQRDEIRFVVLDSKLLPGTYLIGEISSESDYQRRQQQDTDLSSGTHRDLQEENFLRLSISDRGRIKHVTTKVKGVTIETLNKVLIIYDEQGFSNLAENRPLLQLDENDNDLLQLARLIKSSKPLGNSALKDLLGYAADCRMVTVMGLVMRPFMAVLRIFLKKTALFYHFSEWYTSIRNKGSESAKWALLFDIGLGVAVLSLVLYFGNQEFTSCGMLSWWSTTCANCCNPPREPHRSEAERPTQRFFLGCFLYHVDLWWTFLIIVSPAIRFLFIPLSVLGLLGLSFQLAMLSDLIILISLHAHCFYIYAAVLYRIEIGGIRALCRIVLGKKKTCYAIASNRTST
uniref:Uncharacterized protein n=1 Tax=Aedes aegypti TaxID=7159 RepID=A0A903VVD8_AEDAE